MFDDYQVKKLKDIIENKLVAPWVSIGEDLLDALKYIGRAFYDDSSEPFHKTFYFRRMMYERRYYRNSHKSNRTKRRKHF